MLEAVPISIDLDADLDVILGTKFETSFSPRPMDEATSSDDPLGEFLDFDDPEWDTIFQSFDQEQTLFEQKDAQTFEDNTKLPTSVEPLKCKTTTPKVEKRKREDCNDILMSFVSSDKRKRLSGANKSVSGDNAIKNSTDTTLNLFAAPRYMWSIAKQNRFDAMQRLQAKKREGRFGLKLNKKSIRKKLANSRKRTKKGQFARTSKFKWVSVCDLQS